MQNLKYDIAIASYIIDVADGKYQIDKLIDQYLELSVDEYLEKNGAKQENIEQMTLFENSENNVDSNKYRTSFYAYCIFKLSEILTENGSSKQTYTGSGWNETKCHLSISKMENR